jgi:hypothetical protein
MHARKRGVESFEKLSREGKIKRKVWVWKRKKERMTERKKERKKEMWEWKNEWKRKRKKRGGSNKDMRGMDQVKKRKLKCKDECHVVERRNFHSFPTICNPTTRTSSVPCSHNFLLPLHMSIIQNLLILDIPTYG